MTWYDAIQRANDLLFTDSSISEAKLYALQSYSHRPYHALFKNGSEVENYLLHKTMMYPRSVTQMIYYHHITKYHRHITR